MPLIPATLHYQEALRFFQTQTQERSRILKTLLWKYVRPVILSAYKDVTQAHHRELSMSTLILNRVVYWLF